ncbi:TPA: peptidoglycan bridge formation glycyltransferase FemA/FemB family protein [Streptococcus suis]|uniref:peptidoglycan bridge formation glycyltransferase FemA/FemB family protein n=1 Tax=Streptococcus suis TaxID=1307 RepID=UPI001553FB74|nr:peptidoglycan bridge formation glycyltransferase FemA/FemB family protein [Streptococcus suis]MDY7594950.1 peptidoglycan bridge formation glycyltransferase FemA/FemB family protein [Streptococcus suis]NQQ28920.1 peptidoglycan bridge formation glycyltransferase FemA/FemB family protein [Streptococcus suis]HEL2255261.1 peptidoglycan bridge formation glycyltransferase FemA/FemB family protein [Streptococcus suis]HEL2299020.1 peptidoglycan bridge formation glycyltransferase FemA/FemB family prot
MVYTYKIGISEVEHDGFLKQSPQVNLLQSSQWATVKSEWRNERLGFFKDGKLVAVASLLIRRLVVPFGFTMIYIPRGPVMNYEDAELVSFVFKSIKEFALRERSVVIKFDPFIRLSSKTITGDREEELNVLAVKDRIVDLGGIWSGRVQTMSATIQPTCHAVLYSESFSEESLNKRVRQNIRSARNKGIEIRIGREELLRDFSELLKKTEERKSIRLRGREYYQKILNAYPENSYIVVAYLDLAKRYEQLSYLEEKLVKESMTFTSTTRQSKIENYKKETRRINAELEMINSLIRNGSKLVPLAGTLTIDFAGTSENIYAGMDEKFKHYQPALLTWVETAKYAFERGVKWQNLGGIEPTLDGGLYHFKSHLNPVVEEYIGEFDLIVSPILYKIFQVLLEIRKKLRKKK